ncbi:glycosyltransferase [Croceitalea rosinachiae]|uniref:Glycosyltransferase n=1 Tax=Croceitalea rosinachiae TaxID=3075596 RepID=A0ABU3ABJ1_9FLAO|nr:glycosyltransferase [Croceitalea sp. F388]MDT0607541.1 glycosyltransferase [Croceitalea sp. F388]
MAKALFIGYIWPEPKTTAAGQRMLQLLKVFKEKGFQVTFATTAVKTKFSEDLEQFEIQTESILLNDSSFNNFVKELKPDVVIFDRFMVEEQFGWRVAQCAPKALRILNTEDLHSLRNSRQLAHKKGEKFTIKVWLQNNMTKREIASVYRSDLTLLVSHYERKLLTAELKISSELLFHLPFLLDTVTKTKQETYQTFEKRSDFICFGNGKHTPNIDAVRYLKEAIWPLIRKELPFAKVHIYGAYLPQRIKELNQPQIGFLIHGWMDDLDGELRKARINLAPLRFGAGIKGKLTEAMQNGTPTVTTTIGSEGMFTTKCLPVVIAKNTLEFAQAAVALYKDENKWVNFQSAGFQTINSIFNKNILAPRLFEKIEKLQQNLVEHRTSNFIGGLLQDETMASTKFMSKWIEEKNKEK